MWRDRRAKVGALRKVAVTRVGIFHNGRELIAKLSPHEKYKHALAIDLIYVMVIITIRGFPKLREQDHLT